MSTIKAIVATFRSVPSARITSGATISDAVANGVVTLPTSSTCTGSGGVGTLTYAWAYVSGSTQITAVSASSATTDWQSSGTNVVRSATYVCTVTDSLGQTAQASANITATHGTPP